MVKYRDIHTFFIHIETCCSFFIFIFIFIYWLPVYCSTITKRLMRYSKFILKLSSAHLRFLLHFVFEGLCVYVCLCVAQQIFILIIPKLRSALISWNFHVSCELSIFFFKCCCCCLEEFSLKFSDLRHFNSSDLSSVDLRQFSWCVW